MQFCNFYDHCEWDDSHAWEVEHPPPVKLRPDEDEGVDPDVQLPVGVGGVQQPDLLLH